MTPISRSLLLKFGTAALLVSLSAACTDDLESTSSDLKQSGTFAVALGSAGSFVILANSGISTVPPAAITGDIGVSPIAATAITGFS